MNSLILYGHLISVQPRAEPFRARSMGRASPALEISDFRIANLNFSFCILKFTFPEGIPALSMTRPSVAS